MHDVANFFSNLTFFERKDAKTRNKRQEARNKRQEARGKNKES
jgi:hypothetical protein